MKTYTVSVNFGGYIIERKLYDEFITKFPIVVNSYPNASLPKV